MTKKLGKLKEIIAPKLSLPPVAIIQDFHNKSSLECYYFEAATENMESSLTADFLKTQCLLNI